MDGILDISSPFLPPRKCSSELLYSHFSPPSPPPESFRQSFQDLMESGASEGETENMLSSRSIDLLRRFSGGFSPEEAGGGDSYEIELGLSLGGCFNNSNKNQILRASSIPAVLPSELPPIIPLSRACSLQGETEEEMWRKKEIQSMKRKEAKRKREERMNFRRVGERGEELEEVSMVKMRRFEVDNGGSWIPGGGSANGGFTPAVASWIDGAGLSSTTMKAVAPASQGSGVSQGSSSSGGSEFESRQEQGFELSGFSFSSEVGGSSTASPFPPSPIISKSIICNTITNDIVSNVNLLRKIGGRSSIGSGELSKNMDEMPSVSTKGEGPNGQRIEGLLYKYGRGEEVRIVCICHGSFLTPAEFVKHAGGGEVAYPLRHIVVNPSPATFS